MGWLAKQRETRFITSQSELDRRTRRGSLHIQKMYRGKLRILLVYLNLYVVAVICNVLTCKGVGESVLSSSPRDLEL